MIQTLIGSHQTGSLIVSSPKHERVSEIVFFKGNIVRGVFQHLKGDDAVFQLFQSKPEGEFAFTSREVEEQQRTDITLPGISLLMESIRMSDELPMLQERLTDRKKVFKATAARPGVDRHGKPGPRPGRLRTAQEGRIHRGTRERIGAVLVLGLQGHPDPSDREPARVSPVEADSDVIVAGAGIVGLSAACALAKRGVAVHGVRPRADRP